METINYILRKLEYLEKESKRQASSTAWFTATTLVVGGCLLYLKNRKIYNLKTRVKELEDQLKEAENTEKE